VPPDAVNGRPTRVRGRGVLATESACEECLVPADVLKMIISGGRQGAYVPEQIGS
jgi:hypothetical protein